MTEHVETTVAANVTVKTIKRLKSRAAYSNDNFTEALPQELLKAKNSQPSIQFHYIHRLSHISTLLVLLFSLNADES